MIDKDTKILIKGIPEGYNERTHSGASSIFYPKGKWNKKEFEFQVSAPKKGMKSEFIDGAWYWVCGCPVCLGVEHNVHTGYFICEEHNVCVSCGVKSKDLPKGVTRLGAIPGFRCSTCQDKIDYKRKIEVLEKFESEEHDDWDFMYNDKMLCPHCGSEQDVTDTYESTDEIECSVCGGYYDVEIEYTPSYSTKINGDRVTSDSINKEYKK